MQHTPGPWEWRNMAGAGLGIFGPVEKGEGVELPVGMPPVMRFFELTAPQNIQIACERWVQFEPKGWGEMQVANARLIAAAPVLLKQLTLMVELFDGYQGMELQWAKDAIAKATTQT